MGAPALLDVDWDDVTRLERGEHSDPHGLLGWHDAGGRAVVRAWRPGAVALRVLTGGSAVEMTPIGAGGLFAADIGDSGDGAGAGNGVGNGAGGGAAYRLQADYAGGPEGHVTLTFDDPYRFWPTVSDFDLHLFGAGRHHELWRALGAHHRTHKGVDGVSFAVWAPNARAVRLAGDWNFWDGYALPMRALGSSGVWELFVPGLPVGSRYKFEVLTRQGWRLHKADPLARATEMPPASASVVEQSTYLWGDAGWLAGRAGADWLQRPVSIYEVHLGSWRRLPEDGNRPLTYRELADELPAYVEAMGFTHVELLPVSEHPFGGSWGYQVSAYFASTARYGSPDDFRALVDAFHQRGIGVVVDWVPGHFPRDEWALVHFDGTALYEHDDPRRAAHPEWGTLEFNFGRHEVRSFLISSARYWLDELHVDGLRVDAVASMLYLDYGRQEGEWVGNEFGGREDTDAVSFLQELNEVVHAAHPGVMMVAEESTSWPAVSRPAYLGGLGFGFKWNMGWMHDTLEYFAKDPIYRRYHQQDLTFGLLYAFFENFILPLSHDEVVHGKGSLLDKMPGDRWQKAANLRALLAWMWAHPGKQLLFMGGEFGQSAEWHHDRSLDWHLLQYPEHHGVSELVKALNTAYRAEPALWERDFAGEGFRWIDLGDVDGNVLSFLRFSADGDRVLACVANLAPVVRSAYRVGLPRPGGWREVLNTDAACFAGSGAGNAGWVEAEAVGWHGEAWSAELTLPPLGVLWLVPG